MNNSASYVFAKKNEFYRSLSSIRVASSVNTWTTRRWLNPRASLQPSVPRRRSGQTLTTRVLLVIKLKVVKMVCGTFPGTPGPREVLAWFYFVRNIKFSYRQIIKICSNSSKRSNKTVILQLCKEHQKHPQLMADERGILHPSGSKSACRNGWESCLEENDLNRCISEVRNGLSSGAKVVTVNARRCRDL